MLYNVIFWRYKPYIYVSAQDVNRVMDIPDYIISYAEKNKNDVFDLLAEAGEVPETEKTGLWLANPYIVYNSSVNQEAIYYFPVVKENNIISIFTVLDTEYGLMHQCGDDIAEYLNEINYLETNPVIYEYNNSVYAENNNSKVCLYSRPVSFLDYSTAALQNYEEFFDLTYAEKYNKINQKIPDMVLCEKGELLSDSDLSNSARNSLDLHNPMGQYGYDMRWASSVATVINYKKTITVTPYEICDRMGTGYNDTGNIYDEQDALNLYGVSYEKIRFAMLGWNEIKDNIDSGNPVIANLACVNPNYIGHAVTVYGYTSSKKIEYWDSYLNNGNGESKPITYSSAGNSFLEMKNHAYCWQTSLSKK